MDDKQQRDFREECGTEISVKTPPYLIFEPDWVDELLDEIDRLRALRPPEMGYNKILFKQCELGHGRLIGENWIDGDCIVCERDRLRAEVEDDKIIADLVSKTMDKQSETIKRLVEENQALKEQVAYLTVALSQKREAEQPVVWTGSDTGPKPSEQADTKEQEPDPATHRECEGCQEMVLRDQGRVIYGKDEDGDEVIGWYCNECGTLGKADKKKEG